MSTSSATPSPAGPGGVVDRPAGSHRDRARPTGDSGRRLVAGRYHLDELIGHGSGGTMWAATDQLLGRRVALKKISIPRGMPPAEADEIRQRTLREARAAAALSSPHIVAVFDILASTDTGPVIIMELLTGPTLAKVIRDVGPLPIGQAGTVAVAVGSALLVAHATGITHRDVKPANIMITTDGLVKLTDFGIARTASEHALTRPGLILGSPAYLAPEIATGQPAGVVSDAWSLGATLFTCVEGRPPFDRGSPIDTLDSVVNDRVPSLPRAGSLGVAISGLLVKSPTLRMTIDDAMAIFRAAADDPSGTRTTLL